MGDLVGRQVELAALVASLDRLGEGRASWARVVGEPGIGKTFLLRRLCEVASARGALVLAGRGAELERDVPFGLLVDACDDHLRSLNECRLATLCGHQASELAPVFPALAGLERPVLAHSGRAARDGLHDERYRVHRALRVLLERLAATGPLVLALDDLQWADAASMEFLSFLLRHPPEAPVLLALAWRSGQAPRLADALSSAGDSLPAAVTLSGLDEEQVGELLGGALDRPALRALYQASQGNPFYAQALAPGITLRGGVSSADLRMRAAAIPEPVAAAVRGEIDALPAPVRLLAQGAAVAGEPFEPDLAAACAGVTEQAALAGLDQLVTAGIVHPADGPRRFAFRHPIVLRVVYDSAGPGWRLAAHARAAAELAQRGAPITARAHHVALAAAAGDLAAAALLAAAAAEVASRAPASAADWLEAALRLLPVRPDTAGQRLDLLVRLARVHGSLGRLPAAHDAWEQALALVPADDPRRIQLVAAWAGVEHGLGRWAPARAGLTAALAALPAAQPTAQAALCLELALSWLYTLDLAEASAHATRAASLAAGVDRLLCATADSILALVEAVGGQPQAARVHLARAAGVLDGLDDDQVAARLDALYYVGWVEDLLEDYPAALRHLSRGISAAEDGPGSPRLIPAMGERARLLAASGQIVAAREAIGTAVEIARLSGLAPPLLIALSGKVTVLTTAGDLDAAVAVSAEALRLDSHRLDYLPADIRRQLALARLEAGDPERFLAEIAAVEAAGPTMLETGGRCLVLDARTQAELELGHPAAAAENARLAEEAAADLGLPVSEALARRARARVLAWHSPAEALPLAQQVVAAFDRASARVQAAKTRTLVAAILARLGRRGEAMAELGAAAQALTSYGALGSAAQVRRMQRRLRRSGPGLPRGGQDLTGAGALSRREREVAELVAQGLTNRDIAAALHISAKTVETHLSRILAKLGISGRAAVARAMAGTLPAPLGIQVNPESQGFP